MTTVTKITNAHQKATSLPHNHKKVQTTENQLKVIKDKYLRDSPTVDDWLMGVAANVALSEILHHKSLDEEKAFKDVSFKKTTTEYNGQITKNYLLHEGIRSYGKRNKNFKKFIANLYDLSQDEKYSQNFNKWRDNFFKLMSNWEFLPNSPTLMNAGRDLQQLSACYVLPVGDSIEEIYDAVKNMALIHKSGGGTGFSFSRLRPANDKVQTTRGISSGPLSFMQIFDKSTDVVKQGGTRRGANMGILRYDHPDILDFIEMKSQQGVMENFNVSVAIDDKFMAAVHNDEEYDLINPHGNKVQGRLKAKDVWDAMIKHAWESGDPGFVVIDRINSSHSNPTPALGQIESTNPCGEQPLLPNEPCNLGSINLTKFVKDDGSDFNWEYLQQQTATITRFLDNVIDINNYPLTEIEEIAKSNRRIGLGVMGLAESLVKLKIPYNDDKAFEKAAELMKFINDASRDASIEIAKERGVFANFKDSIHDKHGVHFNGEDWLIRNCARTTIAPTGTIAITAGLQGSGIEPFFAIVYTRYNAKGIDALKDGRTPDESDTFFEVNPLFEEIASKNNYWGLKKEELWRKIDKNHKAVKGITEIPEDIQDLFLTSHDLSPFDHVNMQVAFQKHIDNAVSKTVNLRSEATVDDVRAVYELAYKMGAKGVTIYRDGSKQFQVLNLEKKKVKKRNGHGEKSAYYEIETGYGSLHIHINYDEDGPTKVFVNITPLGTEISGLTGALGILISKYLEAGGDASRMLKHLNSIKGDKPFGFGKNKVDSIPHGISKALRDHLIKTGKLELPNGQITLVDTQSQLVKQKSEEEFCPKCYSTNVGYVSGCSEPTCFDCGYSKCS